MSDQAKEMRRFIHRYRDKHVKIGNDPVDPTHTVGHILESMSAEDVAKLNGSLNDDIINFLGGDADLIDVSSFPSETKYHFNSKTDQTANHHRLNAKKDLIGENAPDVLHKDLLILKSLEDLLKHNLIKNVGTATKTQITNIHRYSVHGNYLNNPMKEPIGDALNTPNLALPDFKYKSYQEIIEGLKRLRLTNRLVDENEIIYRGMKLPQADFDALFGTGSPTDIPLKGFFSATRDIEVAKHFANLPADWADQRVVFRVKSKYGVDIDDFAEYGSTLGPENHALDTDPAIIIQQEVLLEEGLFKKLGDLEPFNGPDGTTWFYLDIEELGVPIRNISGGG